MFSSKAQVLNVVKSSLVQFTIPDMFFFKATEFQSTLQEIVDVIDKKYYGIDVVVRSSAADEDGKTNSSAGEYESVLNVPSNNPEKITKAINRVIASYEKKRPLMADDEVIIQEMVKNTTMSGVIFTYDLNTGAPYYVINYDDQSGLTDTVTSGGGEYANRTLYIHRNSINKLRSERFTKLLQAVQELEKVMGTATQSINFVQSALLNYYKQFKN